MPNSASAHDNRRVQRDTLIDFFRDLCRSSDEFLVYDDGYRRRSYTYEEVGRAARGFAARLSAAGLQKGDKVVFWGENRPEWIACYWGCLINGIIVVPIDYRSSPAFVTKVPGLVGARVMLLGDDVPPLPAGDGHDNVSQWRFADFDWRSDAPMPDVAITRDDIIQIIFTSGATAEPKGVVIRHRNVLANIVPVEREVIKYRRYGRPFHPIRFLNLLPLSHMFGQAMATNVPPMLRGTVVFTRSFNPHDIVRLIRARRISVLVCVPKILDVLREHVDACDPGVGGGAAGRHVDSRPLVEVPARALGIWPEVLGVRSGSRAVVVRARRVLAPDGLRGPSGLWPHRNGADRDPQPSFQVAQGRIGRRTDRRRRGADRRRRRDPRPRGERDERLLRCGLERQVPVPRSTPTDGCTPETSASAMPRGDCSSRGGRRR